MTRLAPFKFPLVLRTNMYGPYFTDANQNGVSIEELLQFCNGNAEVLNSIEEDSKIGWKDTDQIRLTSKGIPSINNQFKVEYSHEWLGKSLLWYEKLRPNEYPTIKSIYELGSYLGKDTQSVMITLDHFIKKGFVERIPC